MKITLKKVFAGSSDLPSGKSAVTTCPTSSHGKQVKWQFVEQPTIYLCQEVERVLNLNNVPLGTVLEVNIDKFCVIPPGGC
jgi:hypothetical protein